LDLQILAKGKYKGGGRELHILPGRYAICRLEIDTRPLSRPEEGSSFWSLTAEADEMTLVCDEDSAPGAVSIERGWRGIRVAGEIPFTEVGVLAGLAAPLAASSVSIYAVSTYRTDYVFIRDPDFNRACDLLREVGFRLRTEIDTSA